MPANDAERSMRPIDPDAKGIWTGLGKQENVAFMIPFSWFYTYARLRLIPAYVRDAIIRMSNPTVSGIVRTIEGGVPRRRKKRLCLFAHYDRNDLIDDYVTNYLRELHGAGAEIIFCTTSTNLPDEQIDKIRDLCSLIIVRQNIGYDFASYREAVFAAGDLGAYDQLILANDSVYGPISELEPAFRKMSETDADFWGITDSYEFAPHLQSYFMVFSSAVFNSSAFKSFWAGFANYARKGVLIQKGELGLSKILSRAGFRMGSLCEYRRICAENPDQLERYRSKLRGGRSLNPTHYFWDLIIRKYGCPFVKVELLRDDPTGSLPDQGWRPVLSELSDYDATLIERHLARVSGRK